MNELPQMHSEGIFVGFHPYLKERASWKDPLCRVNPCSCTESDDSQMDAPFSLANSIKRHRSFGRDSHMMAESDFDFSLFIFLTFNQALICSHRTLVV